jgi:hypothetical protein
MPVAEVTAIGSIPSALLATPRNSVVVPAGNWYRTRSTPLLFCGSMSVSTIKSKPLGLVQVVPMTHGEPGITCAPRKRCDRVKVRRRQNREMVLRRIAGIVHVANDLVQPQPGFLKAAQDLRVGLIAFLR